MAKKAPAEKKITKKPKAKPGIIKKIKDGIKERFATDPKEEAAVADEGDERLEKKLEDNSPEKLDEKKRLKAQELNDRLANYNDRMKRYMKQEACPECKAFPVVCVMKRPGYTKFRCRECGHRWETKISDKD